MSATGRQAEILGNTPLLDELPPEEILVRAERRLTALIDRRGIDEYVLSVCKFWERQYDMAKVVAR